MTTKRTINELVGRKVMGVGDKWRKYDFAGKIEDAWLVVEKLSYGKINSSFELELFYEGYWALFTDDEGNVYRAERQNKASLAICIASLKAKGIDIDAQ